MYYYIFDLKKCKKRSLVADIKSYLSVLGISGEFTYPSAAYNTKELVELGLSKKYNTIVGIGGDEIADEISGVLCGRSEAMGIIPIEASEDLSLLLGTKNWKEACDNLRFRRILEMKIGKTANGGSFLTTLNLDLKTPTDVTVEFRDFIAQAKVKELMISNFHADQKKIDEEHLDIILQSVRPEDSSIWKITLFGSKKEQKKDLSLFRARSLRLFTSSQISLVSNGHPIAKTPQLIEASDDYLRLIVGKRTALVRENDL
jgi:diacylglycerol kinase family enzyme